MDAHVLLKALAVVLCTAGVTTVIFQRLHQPVVLGYILAGLIVGPHVPVPLIADRQVVQSLSELGVILLMFALGLEFSFRKLLKLGPTAGFTALLQCSILLSLGFLVGRAFGWTSLECIFTGAIIAISSTTIIAKAFDEQGIRGKLRDLVVGILIVEDLIAILLMAVMTTLASGDGLTVGSIARTGGRLLVFLAALTGIGMLVVPWFIRFINRLGRAETTLVGSIGICFAISLLAYEFGYSVALGAFIAGALIGESGEAKKVEHLIQPVRDMFAAIFFVSVGMLIDPSVIVREWRAVAVLSVVVILGKVVGVAIGAFLTGNGVRTSVQSGMSLAQIGEFSFIIAGLGVSLNAIGEFLYAIAVAVSGITTLTTPWLIRASEPAALWVDRVLPRSLQTFGALYGSWIETLRTASRRRASTAPARRLVLLLGLDMVVLVMLAIVFSVGAAPLAALLESRLGASPGVANAMRIGLGLLLAAPFCIGIFGLARRLGETLAETVLPHSGDRKVDFADAPRRAFVVTLQLAIVLVVAVPLLALTQLFLPARYLFPGLAAGILVLGIMFWKGAKSLHGHVRAGSEMIVQALARQSRHGAADHEALAPLAQFLPGLGEPVAIEIDATCPAAGRTLADLNVRGLTGATVLAITRGAQGMIPSAQEVIRPGDVLAVTGTHEAIEAAKDLLLPPPRASKDAPAETPADEPQPGD